MKTNKSLIAILTSVMFAIFTLAFVARAQSPAPAGNSNTASVVVPSVLPDSLPIGSEQVMLDWAVTNRQWMQNWNPLATLSQITIFFTYKDGSIGSSYVSAVDWVNNSFDEFETNVVNKGNLLLRSIKKNYKSMQIDLSKPLKVVVEISYSDGRLAVDPSPRVLIMEKEIGLIDTVTDDSFRNLNVKFVQSVFRFKSLERVEINIADPAYNYVWPSGGVKTQSVYPIEFTTSEYHVFQAWYSTNTFKARFKVTASGETATYTQTGSKLKAPSVRVLSDRAVEVSMTPGSHTVVETSTDMVNWSVMKDIPWNLSTESQTVLVYPPNSPHRFFRAWSE